MAGFDTVILTAPPVDARQADMAAMGRIIDWLRAQGNPALYLWGTATSPALSDIDDLTSIPVGAIFDHVFTGPLQGLTPDAVGPTATGAVLRAMVLYSAI